MTQKKTVSKKKPVAKSKKVIRIECEGSALLDLNEMSPIQGDLKSLSPENVEKLKDRIIQSGFSFPFFVWRQGKENFIIDGTQRFSVLKELREEGFSIPKLPVAWIEASSKKEAARKLLSAASNYGEINGQGLQKFMTEFDIDFSQLIGQFSFPEIEFMEFGQEFYRDDVMVQQYVRGGPGTAEEWTGMPEFTQDDKTAFKSIVVHFHDQAAIDQFALVTKQAITDKTRSIWYPETIIEKAADKRYASKS